MLSFSEIALRVEKGTDQERDKNEKYEVKSRKEKKSIKTDETVEIDDHSERENGR